MTGEASAVSIGGLEVVKAQGEEPVFKAGDAVRISVRFPIGHFRVPTLHSWQAWLDRVSHRNSEGLWRYIADLSTADEERTPMPRGSPTSIVERTVIVKSWSES